ncbi:hypothetical protein MNBD_NITROSPIRAE02-1131 [hydrothermal vent metagenome]|uniref:Uncharacterized protein n=1 Tax=hydrothermal vent metagenome TaxID=652676 RepID=A0A3B1CJS7_9ZZZZ
MKRHIIVLVLPFLLCATAYGMVFNETRINVRKVTIIIADNLRLPNITEGKIIFTDIGQNRIRTLRRIDIIVDKYGQTAGVRLLYEDDLSGLKSLYLHKIKALLIEEEKKPLTRKGVIIRTITADELASPW